MVDVKSTGLFATDPVLQQNGATTDYWKTGHTYIKREPPSSARWPGFEKSGHFFFNPPLGRGYDDGLISALAICDMLDRNPDKTHVGPARTRCRRPGSSPTMSPHCADETKYDVVEQVVQHFQDAQAARPEGRRASRSATSSPSTACA